MAEKKQVRKYKLEATIIDRGVAGEPPYHPKVMRAEIKRSIQDLFVGVKDFKLTEVVDGEEKSSS